MAKIAFINSSFTIYEGTSGGAKHFRTWAQLLANEGHEVVVFSMGDSDKTVGVDGFKERIIKCSRYPEEGFTPLRVADFLALGAMGFRPTVEMMNRDRRLSDAVCDFNPDAIIVGGFVLYKIARRCRAKCRNARMLVAVDSPDQIYDSFKALKQDSFLSRTKAVAGAVEKLLKGRYYRYNLGMYKATIEAADAIAVPTAHERDRVREEFPHYRKHIYIIPGIASHESKKRKGRNSTAIKRILFTGVYDYPPNMEAIRLIEKVIAPHLPDKQFLVAGRGVPKKKISNMTYMGTVRDVSEVVRSADVCIVPTPYAHGLQTKIIDYLMEGKPVIGTTVAFRGYNIKDKLNAIVEDDINRFPDRIVELEKNPKLYKKISEGEAAVLKDFHPKAITSKLLEALGLNG